MNLRNLVIWGVVVVVLIGLYSMMTGGGHAAGASEITYSQLLSKVNAGEVKQAVIRGAPSPRSRRPTRTTWSSAWKARAPISR
jgi:hypothetical protein